MESHEKPDDKNSDSDSGEDTNRQASANFSSVNPENKSHNMNDLKTFDFNSADEIRQTMKAVLAGNPPQRLPDDAETCNNLTNHSTEMSFDRKSQGIPQSPPYQMLHKTVQIEQKENLFQCINANDRNDNSSRDYRRKRPGRPPKAGTSKKLKRASVSSMYVGKLSNVVPFKRRRYGSESESDELDSFVILY